MDLGDLFAIMLVGAIAGWLASAIVKTERLGLLGNIVVGVIGAFIASFVLPYVGFAFDDGLLGSILNATIGAVILLVLIRVIKRV